MSSAPDLSTPETVAKNPARVNGAARSVVTGPFSLVDALSVSLLKGGDYHLLLRTNEGPAQFVVPGYIGREALRLTNPPCIHPPAKTGPITKPSGQIL